MEREALKLAQKAMMNSNSISYEMLDAITAIKAALAQPAQEPVAWCIEYDGDLLYAEGSVIKKEVEDNFARNWDEGLSKIVFLYTTPPKRPWVGLTDEEIKEIVGPYGDMPVKGYTRKLFDQIEAKLRSKNT